MPKQIPPLVVWGQYLAARLGAAAVSTFDVEADLDYAAVVGRVLYALDRRHRRRACLHLRLAFPDMPEPRINRLVRQSLEHLAQLVVEFLHAPRMIHGDSWPYRIGLGNIAPALRLLNAGKPMLMLTGHLGNWEVLGYLLALLGYPFAAIARPLDNALINAWLLGLREQRGVRIITKWDATATMMQVLDAGGALGFIADQNAGDKGMFVPFFGHLASTYKSIGLLAISREVPILCGYAQRVEGEYRYEMGSADIIYPEEWAGQRDPLYYVTARYMRAIETMVRQCPQQYLWMHRRWKSRPRHEREGKPMSAALRRNLEELPWMDAATLRCLEQPVECR